MRAEANGCTAVTQTDLPADLDARAWVFPAGYYNTCQKVMDYIIAPLGNYSYWNWVQDGSIVASGAGDVDNLGNLEPGSNYQLQLGTPECSVLIQNFNSYGGRCEKCEMKAIVKSVETFFENGICFYKIDFELDNNSGEYAYFNISAPDGEGYFQPNNYDAPPGISTYKLTFNSLNNFTGGLADIFITVELKDGKICIIETQFELPVCNPGGRMAESGKDTVRDDKLILVPNPAAESTTAYYSIANEHGSKTIEVRDMVGRILVTLPLNEASSQIILDSSRYSDGTYLVLLKQDGEILKKAKLVIRKR